MWLNFTCHQIHALQAHRICRFLEGTYVVALCIRGNTSFSNAVNIRFLKGIYVVALYIRRNTSFLGT